MNLLKNSKKQILNNHTPEEIELLKWHDHTWWFASPMTSKQAKTDDPLQSDDENKKLEKANAIATRPSKVLLRGSPRNYEIDTVIGKDMINSPFAS